MVIGIIVYANSETEARERAEEILNQYLVPDPFDYGVFFDEESPVAGKARWGEIPPVMDAESEEGREFIETRMQWTKDEFKRAYEKVKELINKHPMEYLWDTESHERDETSDFRYFCHVIGEYKGPSIWLYDDDGEGIRDPSHLRNVMTRWETLYKDENPLKNKKIYVIPVDVHF